MKMNRLGSFCFLVLGAMTTCAAGQLGNTLAQSAATQSKLAVLQVSGAFIPTRVLVQSPVDTDHGVTNYLPLRIRARKYTSRVAVGGEREAEGIA